MKEILSNFEQSLNNVHMKNKNIEEQYILLKNKKKSLTEYINNLNLKLNKRSSQLQEKQNYIKTIEKTNENKKKIKSEIKEIKILEKKIIKSKNKIDNCNKKLEKIKEIYNKKEFLLNEKYKSLIENKNNVIYELRNYRDKWTEWLDENIKNTNIELLKNEIKKEKILIDKIFEEKKMLILEKSKIQKVLLFIKEEIIKTIEDKNIYLLKKEQSMQKKKEEYKKLKDLEEEKNLPDSIKNEDDLKVKNLIYENEKNVKKNISQSKHLKNLINISNIFWRTNKIINILEKQYNNQNEKLKDPSFDNIKKKLNNIINFIDIKRFNGIIRTNKKLTDEEIKKIEIISEYWNENKIKFLSYNNLLNDIYESIFHKMRIYLKSNTVEILEEDNIVIPCKNVDDIEKLFLENKKIYEHYDLEWSARNIFNGTLKEEEEEEYSEKKKIKDIKNFLEKGISVTFINNGNVVDKNNIFIGNMWSQGLLQYLLDNLKENGEIKLKEVWELKNKNIDFENCKIQNTINLLKDGQIIKTLLGKFIENNEKDITDEELYEYFKHRKESFLFLHYTCNFKNGVKSNFTILDFPEIRNPEQIFDKYIKDDISLSNLMYSNDIKYIKKYNKTKEKPEIIMKKLKDSYCFLEIFSHIKYYLKKLNSDTRLKVIYNTNLENYSIDKFFVNPYKEYKNIIDEENNCLILPIINYLCEVLSKHNKFVMMSFINESDFDESKNIIKFISDIS